MKRLILGITFILIAGSALAQPLYSAKFVCGRPTAAEVAGFAVAPGSYFTAINVHNPGANVTIRKRFSVGRFGEQLGPLSGFVSTPLPAARTMIIECRNIYGHLNIAVGTFIEGVVEIRSISTEVDVVGVYTVAPPNGGVSSITMERVPRR